MKTIWQISFIIGFATLSLLESPSSIGISTTSTIPILTDSCFSKPMENGVPHGEWECLIDDKWHYVNYFNGEMSGPEIISLERNKESIKVINYYSANKKWGIATSYFDDGNIQAIYEYEDDYLKSIIKYDSEGNKTESGRYAIVKLPTRVSVLDPVTYETIIIERSDSTYKSVKTGIWQYISHSDSTLHKVYYSEAGSIDSSQITRLLRD